MQQTPITKSPVPDDTDGVAVPTHLTAAVENVETFTVMRFDSRADRNLRLQGIPARNGMLCHFDDSETWEQYRFGWTAAPWVPEFLDTAELGIPWDGSGRLIHRWGSKTVNVGANGSLSFAWGAFPHGLMIVDVKLGDYVLDNQGAGGARRANATPTVVLPILNNINQVAQFATFNGIALEGTTPVIAGVNTRVNYNLWGW